MDNTLYIVSELKGNNSVNIKGVFDNAHIIKSFYKLDDDTMDNLEEMDGVTVKVGYEFINIEKYTLNQLY